MTARLLGARYRLVEQLATGRIFSLWRADDSVLNRAVILKVLHSHLASDDGLRARFETTARAAAALVHSNIVAVYDTGEDDGVPFVVIEYLGGGSLSERTKKGALPISEVISLGADVAAGLAHAHSCGLIHGYVTPATILFSERGQAKVGDFGIASASVPDGMSMTSGLLESPAYLAPEQVLDSEFDGRADTYALGIILFEALTGRLPFEGSNEVESAAARLSQGPPRASSIRRETPRELEAIIQKALRPRPEDRYAQASEMADDLIGLAEAGVERQPSPPARSIPKEPSFLRTEARWLIPMILLLLLAGGLVFYVLQRGATTPEEAVDELLPGNDNAVVAITSASPYDPEGDGEESDSRARLAHDGDETTAWPTFNYSTENFGELKNGLGLGFELEAEAEVDRVEVVSVTGGWEGSIRISDDGRSWSEPSRSLQVSREHDFDVSGTHRHWMIWITRLVKTQGQGRDDLPYSVGIAEVTFLAR